VNWCRTCGADPVVWVTDRRRPHSSAHYCRRHAPAEQRPWVVWEMLPAGPESQHRAAAKETQIVRGRRVVRDLGRCVGCGGWVVWTWGRCPSCDNSWGTP
jgi:ferric-dicitrate binding protein FerR (iron transport regulator)